MPPFAATIPDEDIEFDAPGMAGEIPDEDIEFDAIESPQAAPAVGGFQFKRPALSGSPLDSPLEALATPPAPKPWNVSDSAYATGSNLVKGGLGMIPNSLRFLNAINPANWRQGGNLPGLPSVDPICESRVSMP